MRRPVGDSTANRMEGGQQDPTAARDPKAFPGWARMSQSGPGEHFGETAGVASG